MHVFLTGANGWIGSAIARDLLDAGHTVLGLVRSRQTADAIARPGVTPLIGSLHDLDLIRGATQNADGIIHTAFGLDISRIADLATEDRRAIEIFGEVFAGSDRPIVVTSGFLQTTGNPATEDDRPPVLPAFPRASEQTAFALADRGLRASVVRNPRSVHGAGERHGFVPMLAAVARDKGISAYVGDGQNLWPSVHRFDAARVYRLALETAAQGAAYHAVAEPGIPFELIAEAIGRQLGLPAKSLTPQQAEAHFGALAVWVAGNGPASNEKTKAALNWQPQHVGLVADIERPGYSVPDQAAR